MCGITAAICNKNVTDILLDGLKRLEYRGYDSAGIAVFDQGEIHRARTVGKVVQLEALLKTHPITGNIGIAHTRWATHGKPTEQNAHPHLAKQRLAVVHNGIIENFAELRESLSAQGVEFTSETDTEVVAVLLEQAMDQQDPIQAIRAVTTQLKGAYALVILSQEHPDTLFAVRSGSPLVIGLGKGENFIASDSMSLWPQTHQFMYLEEGDIASVSRDHVEIVDIDGKPAERSIDEQTERAITTGKGDYEHYMLKEIHEQPQAISNTLSGCIVKEGQINMDCFGKAASKILPEIQCIKIVACGTSYHAGLTAKYWVEAWAGLPCDVEIASEFRYRDVVVPPQCLFVTISQSGETADTLAALRKAKEIGYTATLAICNVPNSSLVREADMVFLTQAGVEVGVASTKAFTAQLTALYLLSTLLAQLNGKQELARDCLNALAQLPELAQEVLAQEPQIEALAKPLVDRISCIFLGRGDCYPIALEGALKLKEISYIHADAYPAGELKHGPLALVDDQMPVIILAPKTAVFDKLKANIQEIAARDGEVFALSDEREIPQAKHYLHMPTVPEFLIPILYTIPLQLLSYYVAKQKGTDVDQPRNLAKSVTVE